MSRLIDADAFCEKVKQYAQDRLWNADGLIRWISNAPTVEAVPLRAHWIQGKGNSWTCSNCGAGTASAGFNASPLDDQEFFCYHCGAKMDQEG